MDSEITIWAAIQKMRELTEKGEDFSMVYMSCDMHRQSSHGVVYVERAKLRKQASTDNVKEADELLNYLDLSANAPRRFYQITLMEFNGIKTVPV